MSLQTVQFSSGTCIRCGGDDGYELSAGDVVKIFLDQGRIPDFPEWIEGIVVAVQQVSAMDLTRIYTVQYESDDLAGAATALFQCDILSLICTSCCEILQQWVDATTLAESPEVGIAAYWINGKAQLIGDVRLRLPNNYLKKVVLRDINQAIITEVLPGSSTAQVMSFSFEIPGSQSADFTGGIWLIDAQSLNGASTLTPVGVEPNWQAKSRPQVTLSWAWQENGKALLSANAYSRTPGVDIAVYGWAAPLGNASMSDSAIASAEIPDSDTPGFNGGYYCVNVTDTAGRSTLACTYVSATRLKFRSISSSITTGNTTKTIQLATDERIASVIQTTAGSGISLLSITYAGDPPVATLTFSGAPLVATVLLEVLIQRLLP